MLHLSIFWKIGFFFRRNPSIFSGKTPNFWRFWEFLHLQWPCSATFQLFSDFEKKQEFFRKTIYVFSKKPKFQTFWDIFLIQVQSTSNWLPLAVSKKTQDFFWKTIFFQDETNFSTFWEILPFQLHPITNFYLWRFLQNQFIFKKPIYFIYYNQFLKVSRSLTFLVAFYRKFATFSSFFYKNSNSSFQKTHHIVPSRNLIFERFENSQFLNAIVEQICYF